MIGAIEPAQAAEIVNRVLQDFQSMSRAAKALSGATELWLEPVCKPLDYQPGWRPPAPPGFRLPAWLKPRLSPVRAPTRRRDGGRYARSAILRHR